MNWTQETIDELIALWRQGRTSYELAAHFGTTRNSICGKLFRLKRDLGLSSPTNRVTRRKHSPTDNKRKGKNMLTLPSSAGFVSSFVSPPTPRPDEGQLASIVDVAGCKWPVREDSDFIGGQAFCNHTKRDDGSPYCPFHAAESVASYSRALIRKTTRAALHLYVKAKA